MQKRIAQTLALSIAMGTMCWMAGGFSAVWAEGSIPLQQIEFIKTGDGTQIRFYTGTLVPVRFQETSDSKIVMDIEQVAASGPVRTNFKYASNISGIVMQPQGGNQGLRLIITGQHLGKPDVRFPELSVARGERVKREALAVVKDRPSVASTAPTESDIIDPDETDLWSESSENLHPSPAKNKTLSPATKAKKPAEPPSANHNKTDKLEGEKAPSVETKVPDAVNAMALAGEGDLGSASSSTEGPAMRLEEILPQDKGNQNEKLTFGDSTGPLLQPLENLTQGSANAEKANTDKSNPIEEMIKKYGIWSAALLVLGGVVLLLAWAVKRKLDGLNAQRFDEYGGPRSNRYETGVRGRKAEERHRGYDDRKQAPSRRNAFGSLFGNQAESRPNRNAKSSFRDAANQYQNTSRSTSASFKGKGSNLPHPQSLAKPMAKGTPVGEKKFGQSVLEEIMAHMPQNTIPQVPTKAMPKAGPKQAVNQYAKQQKDSNAPVNRAQAASKQKQLPTAKSLLGQPVDPELLKQEVRRTAEAKLKLGLDETPVNRKVKSAQSGKNVRTPEFPKATLKNDASSGSLPSNPQVLDFLRNVADLMDKNGNTGGANRIYKQLENY